MLTILHHNHQTIKIIIDKELLCMLLHIEFPLCLHSSAFKKCVESDILTAVLGTGEFSYTSFCLKCCNECDG